MCNFQMTSIVNTVVYCQLRAHRLPFMAVTLYYHLVPGYNTFPLKLN